MTPASGEHHGESVRREWGGSDDGSLSVPIRVGNDVVDLSHPRCRSRPDPDPLRRRILVEAEEAWLLEAGDEQARHRRLWCLWAGKETGFKVASKLRGRPPVFRHRAFEVELAERAEAGGLVRLEGVVRWEGVPVRIEGVATTQFVHLVGWGPAGDDVSAPLLEMGVEGTAASASAELAPALDDADAPSSEEARGIHGPLAHRARGVARQRLAGHLRAGRAGRPHEETGSPDPRVEIVTSGSRPGRTPPRVVVDGIPRPDLDLSLSHHGRYVGWALLLPSPPPAPAAPPRGVRIPDGSS